MPGAPNRVGRGPPPRPARGSPRAGKGPAPPPPAEPTRRTSRAGAGREGRRRRSPGPRQRGSARSSPAGSRRSSRVRRGAELRAGRRIESPGDPIDGRRAGQNHGSDVLVPTRPEVLRGGRGLDLAEPGRGDDVVVATLVDRPAPARAVVDRPEGAVVQLPAQVLDMIGQVGPVEEVLPEGRSATDDPYPVVARLPSPVLERLPLRGRPEAAPQ